MKKIKSYEITPEKLYFNRRFFIKAGLAGILSSISSKLYSFHNNEEYSLEELLIMAEIHCSQTPSVQFAIDTALYDIESQKQACYTLLYLLLSRHLNLDGLSQ